MGLDGVASALMGLEAQGWTPSPKGATALGWEENWLVQSF